MSDAAGALDSGRYRIVRLLGRGGLGEVYLAHDLTLGRDVAIKFVAPEKLADADARGRLLREARAAASLDHPGICTVYETGVAEDGRSYIVMQYIEGETLAKALNRGPLSIRDALTLSAEVAEALGAAHRRSVVHRDLKPGNIMVTPSGHAKLVDFGIAKIVSHQPAQSDSPTTAATEPPQSLIGSGTPAYMSPEQIQQRPIDGRSDLFCLGLVLFECLTARRAFSGHTSIETMSNILHFAAPDPSSLRPELTAGHDELCRRLLAKDRGDRFQSADEVVGAIRLLLADSSRTPAPRRDEATTVTAVHLPDPSTSAGAGWRRPALLAGAALLLVGAAATAWFLNRGGALPPVPPEADVWHQRGTEAIREGAYQSGRKALQQAIAIFPQHVLAYARLAEADAELDDSRAATGDLLRVSQLTPDESRLPAPERLRLEALRMLVLRDVDQAIARYHELVGLNAADAGAWVDLGRAQEGAGLRIDARASYRRSDPARPAVGGGPVASRPHRSAGVAARRSAQGVWRSGAALPGAIRCRG